MAQLAFRAPTPSTLRSDQADTYLPLHRIWCVGRNYAEHVAEMGADLRDPPFFFAKPTAALVHDGAHIPYPPATENLHYEAELAVVLHRGVTNNPADQALSHIWGCAAANDLTRRDLQADAKSKGHPWDMAKGFDKSAVIGTVQKGLGPNNLARGRITCHVNGEFRQDGDLSQMIWPVADIIAHLSGLVTLQPGDVILTGTPAGVGPLNPGDTCEVTIEGIGSTRVTIAR
jgi:fumarylpyruvate hydrolase